MNPYLLMTILGAAHELQETQNNRRSATGVWHAERRRSRVSHQVAQGSKQRRLSRSFRVAVAIAIAFAFIIACIAFSLAV